MDRFGHGDGRHPDVGDARIWYGVRGNPATRPLLLLHGGFGSVDDFDPLIAALAPPCASSAWTARGHGASSIGSEPLTYARLAADVEAVCAALGLETCDILGYSDGGIVGCAAWRRRDGPASAGSRPSAPPGGLRPTTGARRLHRKSRREGWRQHSSASYDASWLNPAPTFAA